MRTKINASRSEAGRCMCNALIDTLNGWEEERREWLHRGCFISAVHVVGVWWFDDENEDERVACIFGCANTRFPWTHIVQHNINKIQERAVETEYCVCMGRHHNIDDAHVPLSLLYQHHHALYITPFYRCITQVINWLTNGWYSMEWCVHVEPNQTTRSKKVDVESF